MVFWFSGNRRFTMCALRWDKNLSGYTQQVCASWQLPQIDTSEVFCMYIFYVPSVDRPTQTHPIKKHIFQKCYNMWQVWAICYLINRLGTSLNIVVVFRIIFINRQRSYITKFKWQRFIFLFLHYSFNGIISRIKPLKTACKNSN